MCEGDGMEEWKECKLGDIVEIHRGASPRPIQKFIATSGMPWVKISDATASNSRFINSTKEFIIEDGISKSVIVNPEDLIVSNSATPGLPKIMKIKACIHDGWLYFSNYKNISRDFLYYKFFDIQKHLTNLANGSVFQNLKTDIVKDFTIKLPPLPIQQKIAAILSSLDNKIELNNKINTNLEQQAGALFKNWFVDCMNSTTKMSDIIGVRDGTHDSPKPQESGYLLVTSKHLEAYSINPTDANFITKEDYDKINERSKVDNGDILLSMIGTVGIVSLVIDNPVTWAIKNMGLFKTSRAEELKYYLLNYLKSDDVRNYIEQHLAGSTQKYISLSELRNLPINIPEKNILEKFNNIVTPIYEQIVNNTNEIKNLKELRDTLLPKLMNGEIKI